MNYVFDWKIKKPCPFCGTSYNKIEIYSESFGYGNYDREISAMVKCPNCMVKIEGKTTQEVTDKWNCRV